MKRALRIAIANLQIGVGTTRGYWHYGLTAWKYRLPHGSGPVRQAAAFLAAERMDVAALCEIGGGAWRTRGLNQVDVLAEASGLSERLFFPTLVRGARLGSGDAARKKIHQGNAVCARFPLRAVANHRLPGTGEPRFLSEAEVTVEGVAVRVFVTHLSLQLLQRADQLGAIADLVGHCAQPTVLAGDFNVSEEAELDLLAESNLQKAASAPTFPSWRPKHHLDYLFFSGHFTIQESYAFDAVRFSDHLPFVAEVVLEADTS